MVPYFWSVKRMNMYRQPMRMGQAPTVNNPPLPMSNVIAEDWYNYSTVFTSVAASNSYTNSIQIEADSDFEIIKLEQYTILDSTATTPENAGASEVPDCTVLLIDTGSGRQLMNIALPVFCIFGTAMLPYVLPKSKRLFARSTLSVQITNLSSGQSYDYIYLSFSGRKIFTTNS
jgi:hypothetical protein